MVIERHQRELVLGPEQVSNEMIDRLARVCDAASKHAVARIEQNGEAHRHALRRELRDRLAFTVLENRIGDGDGGLHDLSITGMTHLVCQGCPPGLSGWLGRVAVDVSHLCCGASVLVGPGRVRFC